jgi:hypothetical protein
MVAASLVAVLGWVEGRKLRVVLGAMVAVVVRGWLYNLRYLCRLLAQRRAEVVEGGRWAE